jgi:hypothetical protein
MVTTEAAAPHLSSTSGIDKKAKKKNKDKKSKKRPADEVEVSVDVAVANPDICCGQEERNKRSSARRTDEAKCQDERRFVGPPPPLAASRFPSLSALSLPCSCPAHPLAHKARSDRSLSLSI